MTDRKQPGATGADGSVAAAPVPDAGISQPQAPTGGEPTRPSIWGGQRSRARADGAMPPGDAARDSETKPRPTMSAAVRHARDVARHEWLHIIADDPNERQRIADDLRP